MANKGLDNLIGHGFNEIDPEKQREIARAGGKASGEARRKKKAMRETLDTLLNMNIKPGTALNIEELSSIVDLKDGNVTAQEAILLKLIMNALKKGSHKDIELIWKISKEDREMVDTNDNDAVLQFIEAMRK